MVSDLKGGWIAPLLMDRWPVLLFLLWQLCQYEWSVRRFCHVYLACNWPGARFPQCRCDYHRRIHPPRITSSIRSICELEGEPIRWRNPNQWNRWMRLTVENHPLRNERWVVFRNPWLFRPVPETRDASITVRGTSVVRFRLLKSGLGSVVATRRCRGICQLSCLEDISDLSPL